VVLALVGVGLWLWRRAGGGAPEVALGEPVVASGATSGARTGALDGLVRARPVVDPRLAERASIAGTVRDLQGAPIAGATVCAHASSSELASADTRLARCSTSEPDGHYRIEGLFAVRHGVTASAAGFIAGGYHRGEGVARRSKVELRPGQAVTGIDVVLEGGGVLLRGIVKDLSGGPIEGAQVSSEAAFGVSAADGSFGLWVRPGRGWVSASAEGYAPGSETGAVPGHLFELYLTPESVLVGKVVRAADGAPVEGAQVTAEGAGFGWSLATAITDAGGSFRLDGLMPGPYKPRAEADDAYGLAEEQVVLGLGETSAPIVIKAHPAFYIAGRVMIAGEGGEQACDEGSASVNDRANDRSRRSETEADGSLRVRGLLPGEFSVAVHCAGYVSAESYPKVQVVDRSVEGLRWVVTRGQAIRGQVVDARGKPVPRIHVSAQPKPDPSQPRAHQTNSWGVETDEQGRFEVAGLLPGDYLIDLDSWGAPRATPPKPTPATLVKGQDLEGLRLELPATGEVRGSVRDAQGRPIARANVMMHDGIHWLTTPADDDGSFHFSAVAAGEYRLTAQRGWGSRMKAPGTSDDDVQGEKVTVQEGAVEEVRLVVASSDGRITGVVRDADGGPLADAFIERTRESDSVVQASGQAMRSGRWGSFWETPVLTDPDGRFVLEDLEEGKHTIRAHRRGGGEAILEHVALGSDVVLTIAETGRMSGTVTLVGGEAPEEFTLTARDEATGFERSDHFFRTAGAWSLAELPAGSYKVRVSAGAGSAEVVAAMTAGQDTGGVRVELAPKVTVRGKVVDLEGKPVPGMRVAIAPEGGNIFIMGDGDDEKLNVTDAAGRYEVDRAPTGKVRVTVMPRNWDDEEYGWTFVPSVIAAVGDAVELAPIKISKRRVTKDEAAGDFGYSFKQSEPGADPLQRRLVVALVRPGSAAATAGLKPGDEIVGVDGQDVTGGNSYLLGSLTQVPPGTVVNFTLASGATLAIPAGKRP